MDISELFKHFPLFYKWTIDKKLNLKDLTILTEFEDISSLKPLLQWIEKHQPSHSRGVQIIDLGGELLLMNKALDPSLLKESKVVLFIEALKKSRQPLAFSQDQKKSEIINNFNLPKSIKAKWIRQNDRAALSIHFQSFSLRDLKQKVEKLTSIYQELDKASVKLWKN